MFAPPDADGAYVVWGGRPGELRAETRALLRLLAGILAGRRIHVALHAEPAADAQWLGEPLEPSSDEVPDEENLVLFTSGTTGLPKEVHRHLAPAAPAAAESDARWLLAYSPCRWAGLSVLLHALRTGGAVVIPASLEAEDVLAAGVADGATHLSLTPSLLRKLLLRFGEARVAELPLAQVTFGGEAATQSVLDTACRLWPAARVTHVLASTEAGDICAVSDGLAGFPAEKFARGRLAVDDMGHLIVDGRPTGDLWERRGDRWHFVGRVEEIINVGGEKVSPLLVEEAAQRVEGVHEARAYAVPNAVLGNLVGLEFSGEASEREVAARLRAALPKIARPARVRRVEAIPLTPAGKLSRREAA